MNNYLPKQYIKIGALTILEYTLNKLLSFPLIDKIIVVIHPDDRWFHSLPVATNEKIVLTHGGNNRSDSVLAGLMLLNHNDWALVHDAARPCVSYADIGNLVSRVLIEKQGGILATKVTDTIKIAKTCSNYIQSTTDRSLLWAAATPQMFNARKLKENLSVAIKFGHNITDEASAMELAGEHPLLIECQRDNIKITYEEDIALARFYLQQQGYYNEP